MLEVKKGNADIVVAAYKIPSREAYLHFSTQPIIADPVTLFVNRKNPIQFTGINDLKGKVVGLLLGDSFGESFDYFLENNAQIEHVSRNEQNFYKLANQRIDFMPVGLLSGQLQSQRLGFDEYVSPLDFHVSTEFYFLAVGRHSELAQHMPFISERLEDMHHEGVISDLTQHYSRVYLGEE